MLPGVWFDTADPTWIRAALLLPVEFALLILLVRPLLVLATLPLNMVTLGLPTLLFNGLILFLVSGFEPAFHMDGLDDAFGCLVLFTVTNGVAMSVLGIDEIFPMYHALLKRLGVRVGGRRDAGDRGLIILQIDGLSWRSLMRAVRRGRMPALSALLGLGEHRLRSWRAGVPSTTPAVQEALFHGTREHVPGYRWYDRAEDVVRVSSRPEDLRWIEKRADAAHEGLLREGSCINSMLAGGAAKRLLTLSAVRDSERDRGHERTDLNLYWLSPWAYTTAVMSTVWDFLAAAAWHLQSRFDRRKRVIGRTWREAAGRAVANSFLRETAFFWIEQDVARGLPAIYSNFVGYDEVAHYAGPDSGEALATLTAFDRKLQRLRRQLKKSHVRYDLVLLADHGQSACVPFRVAEGGRLEDLVAELADAAVPPRRSGDSDMAYIGELMSEMSEASTAAPRRKGWLMRRGRRALERLGRKDLETPVPEAERSQVLVCISGGLAHLYRRGEPRPLTLEAVRGLYPGLVEGLASRPGVACVLARDERGQVLAVGSGGVRNLDTRTLVGDVDPLAVFGDVGLWSRELRRLMRMEDAGDLVVLAGRDVAGRVIGFEEMIGTHGGVGGPQNEPFVLFPRAWDFEPGDLGSPEALHKLLCRQRRACDEGGGEGVTDGGA